MVPQTSLTGKRKRAPPAKKKTAFDIDTTTKKKFKAADKILEKKQREKELRLLAEAAEEEERKKHGAPTALPSDSDDEIYVTEDDDASMGSLKDFIAEDDENEENEPPVDFNIGIEELYDIPPNTPEQPIELEPIVQITEEPEAPEVPPAATPTVQPPIVSQPLPPRQPERRLTHADILKIGALLIIKQAEDLPYMEGTAQVLVHNKAWNQSFDDTVAKLERKYAKNMEPEYMLLFTTVIAITTVITANKKKSKLEKATVVAPPQPPVEDNTE